MNQLEVPTGGVGDGGPNVLGNHSELSEGHTGGSQKDIQIAQGTVHPDVACLKGEEITKGMVISSECP